jgi:RND family efflux transporter MFP subunit
MNPGSRDDPRPETGSIPAPRFRWGTRIALPAGILGALLGLFAVSGSHELLPAVEVHASQVVVKQAEQATKGAVTVQAAGWIEAEPYKSYVAALTDGIVSEVLVLEGDHVKAGQIAVRLVDEDARLAAQSADAKVKEMEASLESARADLAAAVAEWDNPVERNRAIEVAEAELAESKATLEQIAAEIAAEEAGIEHTKSEFERGVGLHGSSSISESELIRRRAQYLAQKAKIEALRMRRSATKELTARRDAELRAAREQLRLRTEERRKLDRSRAAALQAEASLALARTALAEAKLRLERTEIRAPMDGVVMSRLTEPGSKVVILSDNPASARVMSLYDPRRLQARVDVPLSEAGKIGVGQPAEITVEVLPDRVFSGAVTRVLHEANIQKNTLEVKASITDPDPQLRPEMLARVRFLAKIDASKESKRHRVFAPDAAFRESGPGGKAWVVTNFDGGYGVLAERPVQLGNVRKEGWVDVAAGLRPGDLVVTRSSGSLKDGGRARVFIE